MMNSALMKAYLESGSPSGESWSSMSLEELRIRPDIKDAVRRLLHIQPAPMQPKSSGEPMTTLTIRIPVRLKRKLAKISGCKKYSEWVCDKIEKAHGEEN